MTSMSTRPLTILFSGSIGRFPIGGHAWAQLQYLAGLRALGHDVFYIEDCGDDGSWVYDWEREELTTDLGYPAAYVRACMELVGMQQRWSYRAGDESRGMTVTAVRDLSARADLLMVRAVPLARWRAEYDKPRRRAFIDADPGFTQISYAQKRRDLLETVQRCERLFTIAQRIGKPGCTIPATDREWIATVPPVALAHWPVAADDAPGAATHFTTVMQWKGFREVEHDGRRYGQKDLAFPAYLDLPRRTRQPMRVAIIGVAPDELARHGWDVVEGWVPSKTPQSYRDFLARARAELLVAKQGYVEMRGGWFSDRSVCFLASGRPVLMSDTGLDDWIEVGEGLLTFADAAGAVDGIDRINADYERHRRAARRLAERHFATTIVLPPLLEAAMS